MPKKRIIMKSIGLFITNVLENTYYLFYFSLIITAAFFVANILSLNFLNAPIWNTFSYSITLLSIIAFFLTFSISFFLTVFLVRVIEYFLPLGKKIDKEMHFSLRELKENAVHSNNNVMYEEYKNRKKNSDLYLNSKYFFWLDVILIFFDFILYKNGIRSLNLGFLSYLFLMGGSFSILYFIFENGYEEYSDISKNIDKKLIR